MTEGNSKPWKRLSHPLTPWLPHAISKSLQEKTAWQLLPYRAAGHSEAIQPIHVQEWKPSQRLPHKQQQYLVGEGIREREKVMRTLRYGMKTTVKREQAQPRGCLDWEVRLAPVRVREGRCIYRKVTERRWNLLGVQEGICWHKHTKIPNKKITFPLTLNYHTGSLERSQLPDLSNHTPKLPHFLLRHTLFSITASLFQLR